MVSDAPDFNLFVQLAFPGGKSQIESEAAELSSHLGDRYDLSLVKRLLIAAKCFPIGGINKPDTIAALIKISESVITAAIAADIYDHSAGIVGTLYGGGNGASLASAIEVNCSDRGAGVAAEYDWISQRFGRRNHDWKLIRQTLLHTGSPPRPFDELRIESHGQEHSIYFDISAFYFASPQSPPGFSKNDTGSEDDDSLDAVSTPNSGLDIDSVANDEFQRESHDSQEYIPDWAKPAPPIAVAHVDPPTKKIGLAMLIFRWLVFLPAAFLFTEIIAFLTRLFVYWVYPIDLRPWEIFVTSFFAWPVLCTSGVLLVIGTAAFLEIAPNRQIGALVWAVAAVFVYGFAMNAIISYDTYRPVLSGAVLVEQVVCAVFAALKSFAGEGVPKGRD